MEPIISQRGVAGEIGRALLRWFAGWWRVVHLGAICLALALTPSTYRRANLQALARNIYLDTAPNLLWFAVLSALISLVLIRIVVVTAISYGLTQYALEMVVRVLVLELIPLTAAVFAAVRVTIPNGTEIADLRARGEFESLRSRGLDPLQHEVLPRLVSGAICVLMLAAVASLLTLVLAYLHVYGFSVEAFARYTREVGRVFSAPLALIFALKTFLLALAVALIPLATMLSDVPRRARASAELQGLVRMFLAILLIEALSLVGNYY
jgi:phospholipid/cholesterol/gamma-HCH transport system permease protein